MNDLQWFIAVSIAITAILYQINRSEKIKNS